MTYTSDGNHRCRPTSTRFILSHGFRLIASLGNQGASYRFSRLGSVQKFQPLSRFLAYSITSTALQHFRRARASPEDPSANRAQNVASADRSRSHRHARPCAIGEVNTPPQLRWLPLGNVATR